MEREKKDDNEIEDRQRARVKNGNKLHGDTE